MVVVELGVSGRNVESQPELVSTSLGRWIHAKHVAQYLWLCAKVCVIQLTHC